MVKPKRPRIAIFASGSGTTFQAVADAVRKGLVDFDIGLVVSDHEDAGVLDRVEKLNKLPGFAIATEIINKKRYPDGAQGRGQTLAEARALLGALKNYKIDHLSLMGCLRIIALQVIEEYGWKPEYAKQDPKHKGLYLARMTNTHPGILPATTDTFGIHAQEKVLELGLTETAHTFHVVATGVDEGPVIAQNRVKVLAGDTPEELFARVQLTEKSHLPLDLSRFLKAQALFNQPTA